MDGHRCFGLASMYNLTKTTIVSGESGWDVPNHPLARENLDVHQKKSVKILQIVKFGIEEVDQGKISTNFFSVSSSLFALMKGLNALCQLHCIQSGNLALNLFDTKF